MHFNQNNKNIKIVKSKYGLWSFDNQLDAMIYNNNKEYFDDIEMATILMNKLDKSTRDYAILKHTIDNSKKKLAIIIDEFLNKSAEQFQNIKKKYNIV